MLNSVDTHVYLLLCCFFFVFLSVIIFVTFRIHISHKLALAYHIHTYMYIGVYVKMLNCRELCGLVGLSAFVFALNGP